MNLRVNLPVQIEPREKHRESAGIPGVWDGTLGGDPVIVVSSTRYPVVHEIGWTDATRILRHLFATEDGGHRLFDHYICPLEDLISLTQERGKPEPKFTVADIPCKPEHRPLLEKFAFLDSDKHQTPEGVDFIRDILQGLYEIYTRGLIHGDLSIKNIVVCVENNKLVAKLTRIRNYKVTDDYTSLSEVMAQCFACEDNNDKNRCCEVNELFNHMQMLGGQSLGLTPAQWNELVKDTKRLFLEDPRSLLKNPLFWSAEMCLTFFIYVRILIDICRKDPPQTYSKKDQFNDAMAGICRKKDWLKCLPTDMQNDVKNGGYRYNTIQTEGLIRYIRNGHLHLMDQSVAFKEAVGKPPDEYFEYFRKIFPDMLLDVHRVLQYHFPALQKEIKFPYMFESYLCRSA
ncbi:hypothetical protein MKW92_025173 [Papaver armeniacum]|nr:hypothetical protein MKW92_025173 [Papaver armeniacum]